MDAPDSPKDVNAHILNQNNQESQVNMNGMGGTDNGDDDVEIIVFSVPSETETASFGDSRVLDTALNSNKFDIDGTLYTFIVDLESSLKEDDNSKKGQHEEKVSPAKDDLLPESYEQYCSLLNEVVKDIQTIDSKEEEDLPLDGDLSFSENEGVDNFDDLVASVNEQEEEDMSMQDIMNHIKNDNSVTIEKEHHGEILNVTGNSLTWESDKTGDDLLMNDDSVGIVNQRERTVLSAKENSVLSVTEQEEKGMLLKETIETISVYDDKENGSHEDTLEDELPVHLVLSTKKQEYDSFSNIQQNSKKCNRKPIDKHICKICDKHTNLDTVVKLKKQQHKNKHDLYSCDFCLQSFNRKINLVKHMELHCRLDNHSCEICYEECSDQSALNTHMVIHLLAKDDSIPCVYEQDNAKDASMSNVYEHEEDNLLASVEEHERKNIGVKYNSALSATSREEKCSLVEQIVNELKGKAVHVKDNLKSSVYEGATTIGNSITSTKNENLKDIKTKGDSLTSVNGPKGGVWLTKENRILSVYERKENTNDLLTLVKDRHTEISNGIENSVSNLIQQEGKVFFLENERSVSGKDENEQDSNKAAQDFGFPIYNLPNIIKRDNGSVSNTHAQIKRKGHKRGPLKSHMCETCHKCFSSALVLKRHSVLHEHDPPSFACDVCSYKTRAKGNLIRHKKTHGICGVCLKKYPRGKDLDRHMDVHKHEQYICDICRQTFRERKYLIRHIEHHFRVGKVVCKICSIQFPNENSLNLHMHVHGEHLESHTNVTLERQKPKHSCPVCQKQFLNGDDLNGHMTVHSKHHVCDLCLKEFSSQKHLTKHIRNHSRLGFIPCKVCSKKFRDTTSLKIHMKVHLSSDQSKLFCFQCLRQFDTMSDFKLHMLQHKGSHTCGICSQVFSFKSNLTRHVRQYHFKLGILYCQICGKEAWNKSDLTRHMKAKHCGKS